MRCAEIAARRSSAVDLLFQAAYAAVKNRPTFLRKGPNPSLLRNFICSAPITLNSLPAPTSRSPAKKKGAGPFGPTPLVQDCDAATPGGVAALVACFPDKPGRPLLTLRQMSAAANGACQLRHGYAYAEPRSGLADGPGPGVCSPPRRCPPGVF